MWVSIGSMSACSRPGASGALAHHRATSAVLLEPGAGLAGCASRSHGL